MNPRNPQASLLTPAASWPRRAALLSLPLLLAACASQAPDYRAPALDLPAANGAETPNAVAGTPWWRQDATLAALIDEALTHNADLAVTAARIEQARAAFGLARANQGPDAGLSAGAKRSKDATMGQETGNRFDAQLLLNWEIDFWGKYRDASAAAREQLLAAEANREALRLSLASEVARLWYNLLADRERLALVEKTLGMQTREQDLLRRRVAAGVAVEFELRQQEAEIAATQVLREQLTAARESTQNALGVLLGRSPKALADGALPQSEGLAAAGAGLQVVEPTIGLPSSRLLQRPDVRAAEAELKAANFQIGVARAAWFPSLSLTASGGVASRELSSLFDGGSQVFSVGAGLLQPLLYSGRIAAGIDAAEAGREVAAQAYRKTVARAFREVLDALSTRRAAMAIVKAETSRVVALDDNLRTTRRRYEGGLIGQSELLAGERALLAAQASLVDARRAEAAATVTVWAALGG